MFYYDYAAHQKLFGTKRNNLPSGLLIIYYHFCIFLANGEKLSWDFKFASRGYHKLPPMCILFTAKSTRFLQPNMSRKSKEKTCNCFEMHSVTAICPVMRDVSAHLSFRFFEFVKGKQKSITLTVQQMPIIKMKYGRRGRMNFEWNVYELGRWRILDTTVWIWVQLLHSVGVRRCVNMQNKLKIFTFLCNEKTKFISDLVVSWPKQK